MSENIQIRAMTKDDIPQVAQLEELCFSQPWSAQALNEELSNSNAAVFVAEADGEIAGYAGLHYFFDQAEITDIAVFPQYRNRGVGRALLRRQKDFCRKNSVCVLSLEVRESNFSAIHLYESEGFSRICLRKNFYSKPLENGYLYQATI